MITKCVKVVMSNQTNKINEEKISTSLSSINFSCKNSQYYDKTSTAKILRNDWFE